MQTKLLTIDDIKQIISEITLTKTNKVTKISDGSVLSGLFYGMAKVSQKAIKDIAIVESHLYPEFAYGTYLEDIAYRFGLQRRLGALGSSTWVRVVGTPGTSYTKGTHRCYDIQGLIFDFEENFVIPAIGYTYIKVSSTEVGVRTNSAPFTINKVVPQPEGHFYLANEYAAQYGRDEESDESLRVRIRESLNILAAKTLSYLEQILIKVNPNVLRVVRGGSILGKTNLVVVSQNGADFTQIQFDSMLESLKDNLCLTDVSQFGSTEIGIVLNNPDWKTVDLDFRCQLESGVDPSLVRIDIQTKLSKTLDHRFWEYGNNIEWDNILQVVKSSKGVKYVPDNFFSPRYDISVAITEFPRFRGFIMRDMDGVIISDSGNEINPLYYPNKINNTIQDIL